MQFTLTIYSDVPDPNPENPDDWSHPGTALWSKTFDPYTYNAGLVVDERLEWWFDPVTNFWNFPGDTKVFQYDFYVDEADAFVQEAGTIYWLGVQYTFDGTFTLGWKSTLDHWNDDAVWWNDDQGLWQELRYGGTDPVHPLAPDSMDLAFAITTPSQAQQWDMDFGDAPEGVLAYPSTGVTGQFPTLTGMGSWIQHTNFGGWFGQSVDFEPDGNAGSPFPPYDQDEAYQDGDAGLMYPNPYTIVGGSVVACSPGPGGYLGLPGQQAVWGSNLDIYVHNWMPNHDPYVPAYVNVLIDWNQNGVWDIGATPSEHVLTDFVIPAQYDGPLSALLPPNFTIGPNSGYVWARFSITEVQVGANWDGSGSFEDGETEDYLLAVQQPLDFGDAPEYPYPTLAANDGARHVIVAGGPLMGTAPDAEPDGQQDPNALGDDNDGNDDEDGVTFPAPLVVGDQTAQVLIDMTASPTGGLLTPPGSTSTRTASWGDPGEQIFFDQPVAAGVVNPLTFSVPWGAAAGSIPSPASA